MSCLCSLATGPSAGKTAMLGGRAGVTWIIKAHLWDLYSSFVQLKGSMKGSFPSPRQPLIYFLCPCICPLRTSNMNGILQYWVLLEWLPSLSMMFSRFTVFMVIPLTSVSLTNSACSRLAGSARLSFSHRHIFMVVAVDWLSQHPLKLPPGVSPSIAKVGIWWTALPRVPFS